MLTEKQKEMIGVLNRLCGDGCITKEEYFDFMDLVISPSVTYVPYKDWGIPPYTTTPLGYPEVRYENTCSNHEK